MTAATAKHAITVGAQRADLPELHVDQRWRASCDSGWTGIVDRHFRERAAMDWRNHVREIGGDVLA